MSMNRKVVWNEGMFLTPQHFQQWDHYNETLLSERLRALSPFGWGATELDIDRDGLVNGRFALLRFRGVLSDGLLIHVPDQDAPPQIRQIGDHFPPAMERLDVFLGLPIERPGALNCLLEGSGGAAPARYSGDYVNRPDMNTGENPREILVARKNLQIFFGGEQMADTVAIKIAELIRTPAGTIGLRETYIPPCLSISASGYLTRLVRALLEMMTAKRSSFSSPQRDIIETVGMDLGKFALVHTLSAYIPVLTHFGHVQKVHPELLYLTLARLAGELMVLAEPSESKDVPLYYHDDLSRTFGELNRKIQDIVEKKTPTTYVTIPLESSGDNVWVGRVPDMALFTSAQFYLVAQGDLPEEQVKAKVPGQVIVASVATLKTLVAASTPGAKLYHTPRPPSSLPVKLGHQYFRLDNHGVFWDQIRQSQVIALHVPDAMKGLRFELIATKE